MREHAPDFDPNATWKPLCWQYDTQQLLAQARQALWNDQTEIISGVLDTSDRAISGNMPGTVNENEELVDVADGGATHRDGQNLDTVKDNWSNEMDNMRRTEPLAAWANGAKDGPANPQP